MEENEIGRLIRDCLVEKIWEGTTTVLSLDLVRAIQAPGNLASFELWARSIISSCPQSLAMKIRAPLKTLQNAISELILAFMPPMAILAPRPALLLMGYCSASLYLLEHSIWSHTSGESEASVDSEVFKRSVDESGLLKATEDVKQARAPSRDRTLDDSRLVYGGLDRAKL